MKAIFAAAAISGVSAVSVRTFGPKHCVSVYRSESTGTCVMKTACDEGTNLDSVEFAFTCQLPKMLQKHSFGKGGFDANEEFDTNVKCDSCGLPAEVGLSLKKAAEAEKKPIKLVKAEETKKEEVKEEAKEEVKAEEKKEEKSDAKFVEKVTVPASAVSYGPKDCVKTWLVSDEGKDGNKPELSKKEVGKTSDNNEKQLKADAAGDGEKGTCQVATTCNKVSVEDFNNYSIGLICVSKDGTPVRHLFGKKSFDPLEHFNTLIRCTSCLGLDEVSEAVTLEADVKALSRTVEGIKNTVDELAKKLKPVSSNFLATEKTEIVAAVKKAEEKPVEKKEEESDDSNDSDDDDDDE